MALGTGLDGQVGIAPEVTWGTFVSPTAFVEFKNCNVKPDIQQYKPTYLGTGRTLRATAVRQWVQGGGGDLVLDAMTTSIGKILKQMLGAVATSGSGDPYTHTFTPHANGLKGVSHSMQVGVPSTDGTVRPFNFKGGKIASWSMKSDIGNPLEISTTWDFDTGFETTTAIGSPSYGTGIPFIFTDGAATINGSGVKIVSFEIAGDNGLRLDRQYIGNTKGEQLAIGRLAITGDLNFEFEDLTRQGDLVAGTLIDDTVLVFTVGTHSLTVTIPQMVYGPDGSPELSGPDVVMQDLAYEAVDNGTDELITIEYVTSDATP